MQFKYRSARWILSVGLTMLITSCASIVSGTSQTIYIQAIDQKNHKAIENARCVVKDSKGNIYPIKANPGNLTINKGQGTLQVSCTASDFQQEAVGVGSSFNAWTIGNIIFWPGIFVDVATGAIQKYPDHITVLMQHQA